MTGELILEKEIRQAPLANLKREVRLIPRDTVAGRALVVVISIMAFLACLTAGGALLVAQASRDWRSDVLSDVTIQIKPRSGDEIERLVSKAVAVASKSPDVVSVKAYSNEESERLLAPWLGNSLDLGVLPVPRIIVVHMASSNDDNLAALRAAVGKEVPQANLDDHRVWASRIGLMANAIVVLAAALFILVIIAMATVTGFATRGAMAGNREIIEILHFVGASDAFIAGEFQTHFLRLGFRAAVIGVSSAIGFFLAGSALSSWKANSPGGDEIVAMFGAFALGPMGYVVLALIGAGVTLLTGFLSRQIVFNHLRDLI